MLRMTFPILALTALAACASAAGPTLETLAAKPDGLDCAVEIQFTSACCGINPAAETRVASYLKTARGIDRAVQWRWGREGERTTCLVIASDADADRIFSELSAIKLPPPSNHASSNVVRAGRTARLEADTTRP